MVQTIDSTFFTRAHLTTGKTRNHGVQQMCALEVRKHNHQPYDNAVLTFL